MTTSSPPEAASQRSDVGSMSRDALDRVLDGGAFRRQPRYPPMARAGGFASLPCDSFAKLTSPAARRAAVDQGSHTV
jgi:hypothetical protein